MAPRPDIDQDMLRMPPHAISAEQAVLGGLLLVPTAADMVIDRLSESDFYRRDHQLIWRAIMGLVQRGMPIDAVTLGDWFEANGLSDEIGGAAYIIELANGTPSAANILAYADLVREKSILRQLIDGATLIAGHCFNPEGRTVHQVLEDAEERIFKIGETGARSTTGFVDMKASVREAFKVLHERFENKGQMTGISTGFTDLDAKTLGLQPSDLVIVAARPSMGKTAFALNLAEHAAIVSKKAVAVFSMEMSCSQLTLRMIASLGRIDAMKLRTGDLAEEDWPKVTAAITQLTEAKLFIDDTPALSPSEVRSRARRLHREHGGLSMIVIDYLQLMQVPGSKENRATEIAEISRSLKALAKELNVPVVALSQLNRAVEQRTDKRPVMSDLRESGSIEQDADVIAFIYRDEYYNPESADKGLAEIIIGKQRNGPTGTVKLAFRGAYTRFDNAAPHDYFPSEL